MDGPGDSVLHADLGEPASGHVEAPKKGRKRKNSAGGFRKAPQAPKRFKSPYILFSMSKMEEFRKEDGHTTKVTSISRRVAEAWKNLPVEEKKKWEEVAKQDKLRYNAEKSLYTGPWQVPSKRTRKDPTAPKRPMSAFLFFSQGMRQKLKAENPKMKNTEISCLLGTRWKNASEEERRPHIVREKTEREQYKKAIAEWRAKKDEEEKATRKRRQDIAEQFVKSGYFQNGFAPQWGAATPQQMGTGAPYQVASLSAPAGTTPGTFQVPPGPAVASTFQQFAGNDFPAHTPTTTTAEAAHSQPTQQHEQIHTAESFSLDTSVVLPSQGGQPEFQPQNFPDYLPVQQPFGAHQDISVTPASTEAQPF